MPDLPRICVFVSSPSDVIAEREVVERVVARLSGIGEGRGLFRLDLARWEREHYEAVRGFQEAVGEMAAFDVVIGILWKRLGSPLRRDLYHRDDGSTYESGTVFELESAIACSEEQGKPAVHLFRKTEPVTYTAQAVDEERRQYQALESWWNRTVRDAAGRLKRGYEEFLSPDELELRLEDLLEHYLRDKGLIPAGFTWNREIKGSSSAEAVKFTTQVLQTRRCRSCESEVPGDARFCSNCGGDLWFAPEVAAPERIATPAPYADPDVDLHARPDLKFGTLVTDLAAEIRASEGDLDADASVRTDLIENAQFTVYRPRAVASGVWTSLLVFAHLAERPKDAPDDVPDPIEEVRNQARRVLGEQARDFTSVVVDSSQSVPRFGEISFVPEVAGFEFNPPRRTFLWIENVHREDFRCRASASMVGQTARGRLTVFFGSIIIAEVALSIRVEAELRASASSEPAEAVYAVPYRKIFASYSHLDSHVVEQVALFTRTLGDDYVRDVKDLRAGEVWNVRLEEMIREAHVFQLFWSSNSMRSRFVRQEWECALRLQRENFIRPTYWEDPMPESPNEDLPPGSLRSLHFHRLPGMSPPPTRSGTGALSPLVGSRAPAEPPAVLELSDAPGAGGPSSEERRRTLELRGGWAQAPQMPAPRSERVGAKRGRGVSPVLIAAIVIVLLIASLALMMVFRIRPRVVPAPQMGEPRSRS